MWVGYKRAGQKVRFKEVERVTLADMQLWVGGYIEVYPLGCDVAVILNDSGKLEEKQINFMLLDSHDYIVGDVMFMSLVPRDEDLHGLYESQKEFIYDYMRFAEVL